MPALSSIRHGAIAIAIGLATISASACKGSSGQGPTDASAADNVTAVGQLMHSIDLLELGAAHKSFPLNRQRTLKRLSSRQSDRARGE